MRRRFVSKNTKFWVNNSIALHWQLQLQTRILAPLSGFVSLWATVISHDRNFRNLAGWIDPSDTPDCAKNAPKISLNWFLRKTQFRIIFLPSVQTAFTYTLCKTQIPCCRESITSLLPNCRVYQRKEIFGEICSTGCMLRSVHKLYITNQSTTRNKQLQAKSNETPTWSNTVQVLFLQGHSTCFGRKRPSSGIFKN